MLERQQISSDLRMLQGPPGGAGGCCWGERCLCCLVSPASRLDGWIKRGNNERRQLSLVLIPAFNLGQNWITNIIINHTYIIIFNIDIISVLKSYLFLSLPYSLGRGSRVNFVGRIKLIWFEETWITLITKSYNNNLSNYKLFHCKYCRIIAI